jgi:hypothetical protein
VSSGYLGPTDIGPFYFAKERAFMAKKKKPPRKKRPKKKKSTLTPPTNLKVTPKVEP